MQAGSCPKSFSDIVKEKPPAPRVSSSGWGEKTIRRVACETGGSMACVSFDMAPEGKSAVSAKKSINKNCTMFTNSDSRMFSRYDIRFL